ncbi:uncharacterized protein LOC126592597 [Malus sylvestris]|uniref:uncharacterized protein LOC126592597 n=1 Tax=Malus sylvestris TaxID=3752 RepID=UPI0021AB9AD3|nr:uncharacterized protein LOC126592597 [Malus sylvestris]
MGDSSSFLGSPHHIFFLHTRCLMFVLKERFNMVIANQLQILQSPITGLISYVLTSVTVKLDDTNYLQWHFQMKLMFEGYGIMDFMDGTNPCPSQFLDNSGVTSTGPESRIESNAYKGTFNSGVHDNNGYRGNSGNYQGNYGGNKSKYNGKGKTSNNQRTKLHGKSCLKATAIMDFTISLQLLLFLLHQYQQHLRLFLVLGKLLPLPYGIAG